MLTPAWSGSTTLSRAWTWPFRSSTSVCDASNAAIALPCAPMQLAHSVREEKAVVSNQLVKGKPGRMCRKEHKILTLTCAWYGPMTLSLLDLALQDLYVDL